MISWMRNENIVACQGIVSGLYDLCYFLKDRGGAGVMYEIGSFAGESAAIFAKHFKAVHCVDPWTGDPNICGLDSRTTFNCEDVQRSFDEVMAAAGNIVKHVGYSIDVAPSVEDESLDFVYIDGMHDYGSVRQDIAAWAPKVRLGGFVGGHDYHENQNSDFEVKRAVDEFFEAGRATDLHLFGDTSWVGRKI
jgi:predicted O-methyltransferase YrrM